MAVHLEEAVLADEALRVREIVDARLRHARGAGLLPPQIRPGFDVEFDEDSDGDPAIRVWLHVGDPRLPPREDVARLVELTSAIQHELTESGLRYWTYVDVRPGS